MVYDSRTILQRPARPGSTVRLHDRSGEMARLQHRLPVRERRAMKPEPSPLPTDLRKAALDIIQAARFPMLATMDGDQPRLRPVSPVKTEEFTVYVASLRSSHKTGEVDQNRKVELCYMTEGHDQVRITGVATRVTDASVIQPIWDSNPLLRAFLGRIDNPEFILYKVTANRVRFMREWALDYQEIPLR